MSLFKTAAAFGRASLVRLPLARASPSGKIPAVSLTASTLRAHAAAPLASTPSWRSMSSRIEDDVVEFLKEEIAAEKSNLKRLELPGAGFEVKKEGAELTFTKSHGAEKIVVSLNVNHTVDSAEPDDGTEEAPEMKSKPNFEVDIVKADGRTLSFSCSYIPPPEVDAQGQAATPSEENFDDVFAIDEVTMFNGDNWTEKHYAVAGDILDGYLYDLFMNMLDERGVNKEFAEKLSSYCSAYEHSLYINLLEEVQKFAKS